MLARTTRKKLVDNNRLRHAHVPGLTVESIHGVDLTQPATHATVAGVYYRGKAYFGFAFCSVGDNFSRAEGRRHANRRLFELLRGATEGSKRHGHFSLALTIDRPHMRRVFVRDRQGRTSFISTRGLLRATELFLALTRGSLTRPAPAAVAAAAALSA